MAEESYAKLLEENVKKLSSIGGGIEELSTMERPLRRIAEHEAAIQELVNLLEQTKKEIHDAMEEQRMYLEEKLEKYLELLEENVKGLSSVDAVVIDKVEKVERILVGIDEEGPQIVGTIE